MPDLSPAAMAAKQNAEVEQRLQFVTQSLRRLIWVRKGCGNTPVAKCAVYHQCHYWPGAPWDLSTFWLKPDLRLSPAAMAAKQNAEVEARLQFVTQSFLETHLGMERMRQHSCGTVLPAIHVLSR